MSADIVYLALRLSTLPLVASERRKMRDSAHECMKHIARSRSKRIVWRIRRRPDLWNNPLEFRAEAHDKEKQA